MVENTNMNIKQWWRYGNDYKNGNETRISFLRQQNTMVMKSGINGKNGRKNLNEYNAIVKKMGKNTTQW